MIGDTSMVIVMVRVVIAVRVSVMIGVRFMVVGLRDGAACWAG